MDTHALVERAEARRGLHAALSGSARGGRVAVLTGGAGVGKTALLDRFAAELRARGFRHLRVRTSPLGAADPLSGVRHLLPPGPAGAEPGVPGRAGAALAALVGGGPALVTVDDVHLADAASLRLVEELLCRPGAAPLLVVATEPAGYVGALAGVRVPLRPLGPAGVRAVLRGYPAPRPAAAHRLTGGNPRLVHALGRAGGPGPALDRAVGRCLPAGPARRAAHAAAALRVGHPVAVPAAALVGDVLGVEAAVLADLLPPLLAAGLVDAAWRVGDPALAAAMLAGLAAGERAGLHARIARALHLRGLPAPAVAAHLVRVADPDGAAAGDPPRGHRPAGAGPGCRRTDVLLAAAAAALDAADPRTAPRYPGNVGSGGAGCCGEPAHRDRVAGAVARAERRLRTAAAAGRPPPVTAAPAAPERTGTVPVAAAGARVAGLSRAERRVADLAAAGFTNRQIAHRLVVTVSTVEQHLTRVYRKLGVARPGLRALLPAEPRQWAS
ncbi:hypothetical protein GCM10010123_28260 [Pilimelia anulata]|uniref:HTH luxR-type domain-containing protein n=1 Tax=Pilimelia anulata TaxID=53371 RepID=A0A8J3B5B6_9ACTN|nr:hypothetical protein GCM10010123_28260 [Pilimelia anulata]